MELKLNRLEGKCFVAGGAGFIGSHLVHRLLLEEKLEVTIYDNFSSGKEWHIKDIISNPRLHIIKGDIKNLSFLTESMDGHELVYHFASNPDISKAMTQPDIDFWEGTYLTQNILEAMRITKAKKIIYPSGSGIYGETGTLEVNEDYGPLLPISTYGASKLAGEALICSYCYMFNIIGRVYRFANVVGPRQTHGVGFDFVRNLKNDPNKLKILGDGSQSKSYIYIDDIMDAIFLSDKLSNAPFTYFNIATGDYISVKEIADIVVEELNLKNVNFEFTGGDRGWKGDVPVIRFDIKKINSLGWSPRYNSKEAIRKSIKSMLVNSLE